MVERLRDIVRCDFQAIVICGKNEELRSQVQQSVSDDDRFVVLGYTDKMHELMKISDLFVGKPGGLTTSEALACGLPMAITQPIPGQEERNSDHLLEEGIAIKCNELTTLPYKIERLICDPSRLEEMRRRAVAWGKPNAARTVVNTLLDDNLPALILEKEQRDAMTLFAAGEKS
jgi:processive 1,2-diacylglycerol beta-glucosyltransferase